MQRSAKQFKPLTQPTKKSMTSITQLSKNLFDKIGSIEAEGISTKELPIADFGMQINNHYDSLTELLSKAQSIVSIE